MSSKRPKEVSVLIEIEKHSNMKWEYDRETDKLVLDRILPYPYFYPQAYGLFPNTIGNDGDELDALLISDKLYPNYTTMSTTVEGYIVGGIMMYDEKGTDEKIFVVPKDEYDDYEQMEEHKKRVILEDIVWFFTQYKMKDMDRWSRVDYYLSAEDATATFNLARYAYNTRLSAENSEEEETK